MQLQAELEPRQKKGDARLIAKKNWDALPAAERNKYEASYFFLCFMQSFVASDRQITFVTGSSIYALAGMVPYGWWKGSLGLVRNHLAKHTLCLCGKAQTFSFASTARERCGHIP